MRNKKDGLAKCKNCLRILKKGQSTPPFIKHLKSHNIDLKVPKFLDLLFKALKTVKPTSVEVERAFSAMGFFIQIRKRMSDKTLDALISMRQYYELESKKTLKMMIKKSSKPGMIYFFYNPTRIWIVCLIIRILLFANYPDRIRIQSEPNLIPTKIGFLYTRRPLPEKENLVFENCRNPVRDTGIFIKYNLFIYRTRAINNRGLNSGKTFWA